MFYTTEEFFSIQGEGRYAGYPSYFIRTGKCNLSCPGFNTQYRVNGLTKRGCDTYFAVDRAFKNSWSAITDANSFIAKLQSSFDTIGYKPDVVITGGEPLLYHEDATFYAVVEYLIKNNIRVTFETNATIAIDFIKYPLYKDVVFALSVKLSNSAERKEKRVNTEALQLIKEYAKEYFLKFTINKELIETTAKEEIEELHALLPNSAIYCMPVGECRQSIWGNDAAVFEFCKANNYIYSDRLHIRVFDSTQGV